MQRSVEWHCLYLILAYFCTVYRLTVTSEQLSKYSSIYRAGRAGPGDGEMGRGRAPAGPRGCHGSSGCCQGWRGRYGVQLWKDKHGGAEVWMCRQPGTRVSSPAQGTRATAALTGPASLLRASTAARLLLLQSWGPQQRCREEEDEGRGQAKPQAG